MTRRYIRWSILILVVAGAGILIRHYTRPSPLKVVVEPVGRGSVERTVANTRAGTVEACRRAKLSPNLGGQIAKLPVKEGDTVKAGQLLMELWNDDLVAEVRVAESEAEAARARARASCLNAEKAEREADRMIRLLSSAAISEDSADKALTQAKALKAECAAAKASALMSEARVTVVQAKLARTRLTAPFAGVVAKINGELSEYVTPSPIGIPTPPAVDLIDNSCFYVTAPIDEVDAAGISVGMTARVSMDAFGDRRFDGEVRRIAAYVLDREKQARTVDVEVAFTRSEDLRYLLAGYSADVEIILDKHDDALRIPTEAILDGKQVFVYLPERKEIKARKIHSGLSNWDYTEIISGLKTGELVVVNVDLAGLKDGAGATIAEEEP